MMLIDLILFYNYQNLIMITFGPTISLFNNDKIKLFKEKNFPCKICV